MTDIIPFKGKGKKRETSSWPAIFEPFDFDEELKKDIERLRENWSKSNVELSTEEAVDVAVDFYSRYSVLMEYVRENYFELRADKRRQQTNRVIEAQLTYLPKDTSVLEKRRPKTQSDYWVHHELMEEEENSEEKDES